MSTPTCNRCGEEIEWKKSNKTGKNYPVNKDGSFHSTTCGKQDLKAPTTKEIDTANKYLPKAEQISITKRESLYYEGIVDFEECTLDEAKELRQAGWILLKISDNIGFANSREGLGGGTEMLAVPMQVSRIVYVMGHRA